MDTAIPQLPPLATLVLALLLPIIGRLLKELKIPRLDREIPTLLPVVGGLIACMVVGWSRNAFLAGMGCGGLAVAGNQRWRQLLYGSGRSRPLVDTSKLSPEQPWPKMPPPYQKPKGGYPTNCPPTMLIPLLLGLLFLPACKTTPGPGQPVQNQVINQAVGFLEMGSTLTVYFVVKNNPEYRPYFVTASTVIAKLADSNSFDPEGLTTALKVIPGNKDAYIIIASAVAYYDAYWKDIVTKGLNQSAYCRPVMIAMARGIKLGLAPTQAAERYPEYIRPKQNNER